jgi:N-methylhydantoinase B
MTDTVNAPSAATAPKAATAAAVAGRELLRNALAVAAEEASIVVVKAAYSTFVVEGADAAAAILDAEGQLIAQSNATALAHGASIRCSLRSIIEDYPAESMQPGDVYATNDVYRGGIHANDIVVVRPVFVDGTARYFAGTVIHVADVGGESAGGVAVGASEIYGEGIQLPPVRIATDDGLVEEVAKILALNSRAPESMLGDVRALVAGCNVAARRLEGIIAQYGADAFAAEVADFLDYTEARMRADIAALPDGRYESEYVIDDNGRDPNQPIRVRVALTIDGDGLEIDFTGTDPQVDAAINCGYSQTTSAALYGVRCFTDPTIPMNEGCFRPLRLVLPYGSLVNPSPPHAGGGRNFVMSATIDAIVQALSAADPSRSVAVSGILHPFSMSPAAAGPSPWIHMSYEYAGHGAHLGKDGADASAMHFGLGRNTIPQVEPIEARTPFVIEAKEFIPDSGGPGRWRGGLGVRTVFRLLEPSLATYRGDRITFPPAGRDGGGAGRSGGYYHRKADGSRTKLPNKALAVYFEAGDALVVETSGGGGMGRPFERDVADVARDLADGRVTADGASRDYGVTIVEGAPVR